MIEKPNLSYIDNLAGDDVDFKEKFISVIKEEFPVEVTMYKDHISRNEPRAASEVVHKLKHKFNILSMVEAYALAVNYEEELRVGNKQKDVEFCSVLDCITNYLNTI